MSSRPSSPGALPCWSPGRSGKWMARGADAAPWGGEAPEITTVDLGAYLTASHVRQPSFPSWASSAGVLVPYPPSWHVAHPAAPQDCSLGSPWSRWIWVGSRYHSGTRHQRVPDHSGNLPWMRGILKVLACTHLIKGKGPEAGSTQHVGVP
jgi:hypothetical protein